MIGRRLTRIAHMDRTEIAWRGAAAVRTAIDRIDLGSVVGPVTALAAGADGRSFLVGTENRTVLRFEIVE